MANFGDKFNVILHRDYGPYLDKPILKAGKYVAKVNSIDSFTRRAAAFDITVNEKTYYILPEDTTIVSPAD